MQPPPPPPSAVHWRKNAAAHIALPPLECAHSCISLTHSKGRHQHGMDMACVCSRDLQSRWPAPPPSPPSFLQSFHREARIRDQPWRRGVRARRSLPLTFPAAPAACVGLFEENLRLPQRPPLFLVHSLLAPLLVASGGLAIERKILESVIGSTTPMPASSQGLSLANPRALRETGAPIVTTPVPAMHALSGRGLDKECGISVAWGELDRHQPSSPRRKLWDVSLVSTSAINAGGKTEGGGK